MLQWWRWWWWWWQVLFGKSSNFYTSYTLHMLVVRPWNFHWDIWQHKVKSPTAIMQHRLCDAIWYNNDLWQTEKQTDYKHRIIAYTKYSASNSIMWCTPHNCLLYLAESRHQAVVQDPFSTETIWMLLTQYFQEWLDTSHEDLEIHFQKKYAHN